MTQVILRMKHRMSAMPTRLLWGLPINLIGLALILYSVGLGLWTAWLQLHPSETQALQASLLAGGVTGLGALGIFALKRSTITQGIFGFLALSAGAMFAAALLSLLMPAIQMTNIPVAFDVLLAAVIGYAVMAALDRMLPHMHAAPNNCVVLSADSIRLMVIAIAVHNLPEGFAVGAGYGGGDALGWGIALSIGMQNIPEGLIVATALWSIGASRSMAFALAVATGLLEPLGAAIGIFAVGDSALLLPWALAISAGAMMFVIKEELIPEALKGTSCRSVIFSFTLGSLGMAAILTLL
jgi:zinc transporter, ZIP family